MTLGCGNLAQLLHTWQCFAGDDSQLDLQMCLLAALSVLIPEGSGIGPLTPADCLLRDTATVLYVSERLSWASTASRGAGRDRLSDSDTAPDEEAPLRAFCADMSQVVGRMALTSSEASLEPVLREIAAGEMTAR